MRRLAPALVMITVVPVLGVLALVLVGCSGGGSSPSDTPPPSESATVAQQIVAAGTTGKPCASNANCAVDGGASGNVCSNNYVSTIAAVTGQSLPAAVCL